MRNILFAAIGFALLACGCRSTGGSARSAPDAPAKAVTVQPAALARTPGPDSPIGKPAQSVIDANPGRRIEIFNMDGKRIRQLPKNEPGSVSIYNNELTGQDNYMFKADGTIARHLRSVGPNYPKGVWVEVK